MLLVEAQKYLEIVSTRGKAHGELRRVYYNIATNRELYILAYARLYANAGALTPGIDRDDVVDGMSLSRIDAIMENLKRRTYRWKPVRRTYILKRDGKRKRPLGMPGWTDKLLQEVLRMVLEAYYEPQFRDSSHGFRPNRGCHTILSAIQTKWTGVRWFIEGDIKGCFDNLSHSVIVRILSRHIKDNAFLELLMRMLDAGYIEDWTYHTTYSGSPQGGIVSPLIANIVLNELDRFVEDELIPEYSRGKERQRNPEYMRLMNQAAQARKKGDYTRNKALQKVCRTLSSQVSDDPGYRRLRYCRYADDTLLGFIGPHREAEQIKGRFGNFLQSLQLDMSEDKTLITHALTGKARFLNYNIGMMWNNTRITTHQGTRTERRAINGSIRLSIPHDVIVRCKAKVTRKSHAMHRSELIYRSDYDIVSTYETELQGLINYYSLAHEVVAKMNELRYVYATSLLKTLAAKHNTTTSRIRHRYTMYTPDGKRVIGVEVSRKDKKPLVTTFGQKPILRKRDVVIKDELPNTWMTHNELVTRLLANRCELCGKEEEVVGHHIRKLKDLKKRYRGQKEPPEWVKKMIAIKRKTLFVCGECHQKIHTGTYDGAKLT
jgi:group II intron reverse transcriptase/maturase